MIGRAPYYYAVPSATTAQPRKSVLVEEPTPSHLVWQPSGFEIENGRVVTSSGRVEVKGFTEGPSGTVLGPDMKPLWRVRVTPQGVVEEASETSGRKSVSVDVPSAQLLGMTTKHNERAILLVNSLNRHAQSVQWSTRHRRSEMVLCIID